MRGAFGLVSILVCGLIVAYLWSSNVQNVAKVNKSVQPQVQQLAGKNTDGSRAADSAKFNPVERNGALKGIQVVSIDSTGALFTYWGLQPNDIVLRIGELKVGDPTMEDFESVRDWVVEGMQRKKDMDVDRDGVTITLPAQRNAPAGLPGTGGTNSAAPSGNPNSPENILKQLQSQ
jgi:hypothetical protein